MATSRSSFESRARKTSPMPPAPRGERISYPPSEVPAERLMARRLSVFRGNSSPGAERGGPRMLLTVEEHDLVGTRIGHLRVVGFVGAGGMGSVYTRIRRRSCSGRVALKAIREAHLDPERKARFASARRAPSRSSSTRTSARSTTTSRSPERDFLVLELIDGRCSGRRSARRRMPPRGCVSPEQIVSVLVAAHAKGIVHRDLKTVERDGPRRRATSKVLDFGPRPDAPESDSDGRARSPAPAAVARRRPATRPRRRRPTDMEALVAGEPDSEAVTRLAPSSGRSAT